MTDTPQWSRRTQAVHAGIRRSQYGEISEAIYLTQAFTYPTAEAAEARFVAAEDDEFIYARYGNPTVAMFEDRMAALEGAEAGFACASGMAAVNGALMSLVKAGDHIVSSRALFGSCLYILEDILQRFGVEVTLVDGRDLDAWKAAIRPDTKLVFLESISNPVLEIIDLPAVAAMAHAVDALVVVDNVFATPTHSYAIPSGADLVVYSTTKHVDGQGRCLGGIILGPREIVRGPVEAFMKHTGGAMSPFNAWVMLKSLDTLDLRVNAQCDAAEVLANGLSGHPALRRVIYPGHADHPQARLAKTLCTRGGTVLAIDVAGGKDATFAMLNALRIFTISNNFADSKSIVTHPATTTHQRLSAEQRATLGITDGVVRVSCGLEDPEDLLADMLNALEAVKNG